MVRSGSNRFTCSEPEPDPSARERSQFRSRSHMVRSRIRVRIGWNRRFFRERSEDSGDLGGKKRLFGRKRTRVEVRDGSYFRI